MNYQKLIIIILVASLVMYLMRMLPLVFCKGKIKNKFLQSFLTYIPYAVLTSMTIPEAFRCTPNAVASTLGVLVAIVLAYFGQGLLTVALSSTAVVFVIGQIMDLIKF